jgi:hypothetical protein
MSVKSVPIQYMGKSLPRRMPLASIGFEAATTARSANINAKMRRNENVNFMISTPSDLMMMTMVMEIAGRDFV